MPDKPKSGSEELSRIADQLAGYLKEAPASDLLEDAQREGRDPLQTASRVKALFRHTVAEFQKDQLRRTEEAYKRAITEMRSRTVSLPSTPEERRSLLGAILSQQPQFGAAITFQNRDFSDLTDEDVEKHLRKLAVLGVWSDKQGDEDK